MKLNVLFFFRILNMQWFVVVCVIIKHFYWLWAYRLNFDCITVTVSLKSNLGVHEMCSQTSCSWKNYWYSQRWKVIWTQLSPSFISVIKHVRLFKQMPEWCLEKYRVVQVKMHPAHKQTPLHEPFWSMMCLIIKLKCLVSIYVHPLTLVQTSGS